MKYFVHFFLFSFLISCATAPNHQPKLESVITNYCEATNEKNASAIPNLMYPELFTEEITKDNVEKMFYAQLNATKKFQINDLKFKGDAVLLDQKGDVSVYGQMYSSQIEIAIDSTSAKGFSQLANAAKNADPNAKIDGKNFELSYSETKKLILVMEKDQVYILPDVFLSQFSTEKFDKDKVLTGFKSISSKTTP